MAQEKPLIVGIPLYSDCTLMDFAGATQVFAAPFGFKPIWLAAESSITTSEGVTVLPNYDFDYHPRIDILFVPGGGEGVTAAMQNEVYLNFLRKAALTAKWKGSVCTGAFLLAAAGILINCKATTYWSQLQNLALLSQKLNISVAAGYPRFLIDEEHKIFTGGGISSSLDLALELVLRIKGKSAAEKTQLFIQYAPGPPVNSGDPSQAPAEITKQLKADSADRREATCPA